MRIIDPIESSAKGLKSVKHTFHQTIFLAASVTIILTPGIYLPADAKSAADLTFSQAETTKPVLTKEKGGSPVKFPGQDWQTTSSQQPSSQSSSPANVLQRTTKYTPQAETKQAPAPAAAPPRTRTHNPVTTPSTTGLDLDNARPSVTAPSLTYPTAPAAQQPTYTLPESAKTGQHNPPIRDSHPKNPATQGPNVRVKPGTVSTDKPDLTRLAPKWEYAVFIRGFAYSGSSGSENTAPVNYAYAWMPPNPQSQFASATMNEMYAHFFPNSPYALPMLNPSFSAVLSGIGRQSWELLSCSTYPIHSAQFRKIFSVGANMGPDLGGAVTNMFGNGEQAEWVSDWKYAETDCWFKRRDFGN